MQLRRLSFFSILSVLPILYGIAERGAGYKAHVDFIAFRTLVASVKGWSVMVQTVRRAVLLCK